MPATIKVILLILLSEIINTAGQVLFKKSTNSAGSGKLRGVSGHAGYIKTMFLRSQIWMGFSCQVLAVAIWILALAQADLSLVFPLGSMQYIFILLGAHMFLGEKIDRMKLLGTFFVVAGIVIISLS